MNPAKPSAAALDRAQQRVLAALCHEHADSRKPVRTQMLCIACNAASAEKMEGVMLALTALKRAGLVERREGGSWLPTREGRAQAASAPPAAPKPASPAPARVAAAPATPLAPPRREPAGIDLGRLAARSAVMALTLVELVNRQPESAQAHRERLWLAETVELVRDALAQGSD